MCVSNYYSIYCAPVTCIILRDFVACYVERSSVENKLNILDKVYCTYYCMFPPVNAVLSVVAALELSLQES